MLDGVVVAGTGADAEAVPWDAGTATGVTGVEGVTDAEEAVGLGREASVGVREALEAVEALEADADGKTRPLFTPSTVLREGAATADLGEGARVEAICGAVATGA